MEEKKELVKKAELLILPNVIFDEGRLTRNDIVYRQDSIKQLVNNDTRRFFNSEELEREMIPRMVKIDKYFC